MRNLSRTVAAVVAMYGYDFCDYLWLYGSKTEFADVAG